ncbi:Crossover junction endodeoxyribonuclease RuvC [Candidatus Bealeia paramacronuclearis]|uniref:Crossover junction endodeoxyribonuclease RuvC n=1 Tax=Candidatus Bealeia paramacronuclearis TaxID=1921001 RepID=A0ABZ2C4M2_9PROT|nr:Crossover junction endodeoxyribonuclease RuvC [Candidatus Bealeia paramacronuclearis]
MSHLIRILGIDPGLTTTGWALIDVTGYHLSPLNSGVIRSSPSLPLAKRLGDLYDELQTILEKYAPHEVAVEETFVNQNPASALKLGHARGIALAAPARWGLPVFEYAPNTIKKAVVGVGHAEKQQVQHMVSILLSGAKYKNADEADAYAIAICHAHNRSAKGAVA